MNSLRARLILGSALIALVPLAAAMLLLSHRIEAMVRTQAAQRLEAALGGLERQVRSDGERATQQLEILARDPQLRRLYLVRPAGSRDLDDYLAERRTLLGLDVLQVSDPTGRVVASAEPAPATSPGAPMVTVEASAPILYQGAREGTLRGGRMLDAAFLAGLRRTSEIELVLHDAAGRFVATTFPTSGPDAIRGPAAGPGDRQVRPVRVAGRSYLGLSRTLPVGPPPQPRISGLVDTAAAEEAIAAMQWTSLGLGVLGLALAIVLGLIWSSQVTRPVERLAQFSQRLARGDWEEPLALRSVRELETLGAALDRMRGDLRTYRERLVTSERQAAWGERYAGLSRLPFVHDPRRRHTILQGAAVASLRQSLPETALYFQHAALSNAGAWGRPPAVVNVLVNRAEVYSQLDQSALAEADLATADKMLGSIEDKGLVTRNEARILLARGQTLVNRRAPEAVDALSRALSFFEHGGSNSLLARIYLARGRAHLSNGRDDLAEADFLAGVKNFERTRAALTSEALRSSYFEQPWDVFTELIRLAAVRRKNPEQALAVAEQARARTLLETVSASSWQPVDPATTRKNLPNDVTVLYYASLDERLLAWALSRRRLDFVDVPIQRRELVRLLDWYRQQGITEPGRQNDSLIALYDALIRPLEKSLAPGTRLTVVPDGVLHTIPFAALLRRENSRYLVEDYPISVTPSLSVFQLSSLRRTMSAPSTSALVVGNPLSQAGGANLPGAQAEAREIAAMYRNADLLVGSDATKDRFLAVLGGHRVVHFAGHAIPNEEYPGLSRLVLTNDSGGADTVFAHEIGAMRLDQTELVVLAACRTNSGQIRRGEGVMGLARPFIAAGVPTVIASLTDVDDRASHSLFVAFHRAWRAGQSATDALRSAQLEALSHADGFLQHPANWGSFTVIGGARAANMTEPPQTRSASVSRIR